MMLPEIGKLYDQSGREFKTLYDNAGNVIWRSGLDRGTILWQGNQSVGWPGGPTLALSKPISETGEGVFTISDTTVNIFGRTGRYINLSQITAY